MGWEYWIKGKPNNEMLVDNIMKKAPQQPYQKLNPKLIPCKKEQNVLKSSGHQYIKNGWCTRFGYTG